MTDYTPDTTLKWALRISESLKFSENLRQATLMNFLLQERKVTLLGIYKHYQIKITFLALIMVTLTFIPYNIIKKI